MKYNNKYLMRTLSALFALIISQQSFAHVMVAQHGTLNVVEDGVFMVLSLPVSAFSGFDDDKDGKLSTAEFSLHRAVIVKAIQEGIVLTDTTGKIALQGMMLSPVTSHHSPNAPTSQLIVMGRFALVDANSVLHYQVNLFGKSAAEQLLEITATRKADKQKHVFELTAKESIVSLFPQEFAKLSGE